MPINNVANLMYEVVSWGKMLAVPGATIALIVGGSLFFFSGKNGFEKAKPWLIGAFVGLIFTLGANGFTEFLKNKITF
ncbi:hypothetical protein PN398_06725 [Romboutsia sp. 1001216sp1]|uniref:hypothetical protein n=1 Tax=unclassified Romboutsia TaxID=2626894 RepID=UPI00189917A5|nr:MULTISPECIES: hypothetical protein [unclassified Romboutsia]MDB8790408.1 hypothetical protein [Romboutsia sp. 1001216sp1]MDB8803192.1 hypothetical protein [Romboutsia sp. 1001216sp1]MDB8814551.1 hypothetical protein [Romboutsia sp. 1001216sp1]